MGSVVGTAASGVGSLIGNAISAPFRAIFGASCDENVCFGRWDVPCLIEHLCASSLIRVFIVSSIILCFLWVVYKLGIIQCVAKNTCKAAWRACAFCCSAVAAACAFLWHMIPDKRARRRRRDIEEGELSSSYGDTNSSVSDDDGTSVESVSRRWPGRGRPPSSSVRRRRKERLEQSLRPRRVSSKKEWHVGTSSHGSGMMAQHRHRTTTGPRRGAEVEMASRRVDGLATTTARYGHAHAHAHRKVYEEG
ncbi:hypothetical protein ACP4OV_014376 [Aristida adscensionis]